MDVRVKALGMLIAVLGAATPALAQTGAGSPGGALGGGLTLPKAGDPLSGGFDIKHADREVGRASWWSTGGPDRRFDIGLTATPRLGYLPAAGLYTGDSSQGVDVGPGLRWQSAAGTLTASYGLDPTGLSRGDSVHFNFSRPVVSEQGFRMLAFVGAQWQSGRGDRVVPGTADRWSQPVDVRPLYSAGAATNVGFGLDSYYQLTKSSAIMVGASGLRLGGAPADGALYTNRWQAILYGGYAIRF